MKYLSEILEEKIVTIAGYDGNEEIKRRLSELGLLDGQKVRILSYSKNGPYKILIGSTRLAVGYEIAKKLRIEEISEEN
jgi:Fe2+ transport system protein FeoA